MERKGAALGFTDWVAAAAAVSGIVLLVLLNSGWFGGKKEEAPIIYRPPVDPFARQFVYFFAIAPAFLGSLISGLFGLDHVAGGAGVALLMSGLATIVAAGDLIHLRRQWLVRLVWVAALTAPAVAVIATILFVPWTGAGEVATSLPARSIASFFGDSFERRTNHRLPAVTGDAQLAALVALGAGRPHLLLLKAPERTPWWSLAKFNKPAESWSGAPLTPSEPHRPILRSGFPAWWPKCLALSIGS